MVWFYLKIEKIIKRNALENPQTEEDENSEIKLKYVAITSGFLMMVFVNVVALMFLDFGFVVIGERNYKKGFLALKRKI